MAQAKLYIVRMPSTAMTAAKTIIQVKTGAAAIEIVEVRVSQGTKTSTEFWNLVISRWAASGLTPGTVTAATPNPGDVNDVAALAVSGTTATGYNGTAPSGGTQVVVEDTWWNILNGEWVWLPVPEGRASRVVQGGACFTIQNLSTPAASTNVSATVKFLEYT